MNEQELISDKLYPVQPIWALKNSVISLLTMPIWAFFIYVWLRGEMKGQVLLGSSLLHMSAILLFVAGGTLLHFVSNLISRARFHFVFEDNYLTLEQGLFSKQMRHLPYGVIQNIIVTQTIPDRIFGLASLKIENAAESGGASPLGQVNAQQMEKMEQNLVGFRGNKVVIPGLSLDHCRYLKSALETKMKKLSVNPNQSGI